MKLNVKLLLTVQQPWLVKPRSEHGERMQHQRRGEHHDDGVGHLSNAQKRLLVSLLLQLLLQEILLLVWQHRHRLHQSPETHSVLVVQARELLHLLLGLPEKRQQLLQQQPV